MLLCLCCRSWS